MNNQPAIENIKLQIEELVLEIILSVLLQLKNEITQKNEMKF
jgi:hypothetical protein